MKIIAETKTTLLKNRINMKKTKTKKIAVVKYIKKTLWCFLMIKKMNKV